MQSLTVEFEAKLHNESARLDEKIDKIEENFKLLGTNLTEQLQKQEIHASRSWVSLSTKLPTRIYSSFEISVFSEITRSIEQRHSKCQCKSSF